MNMKRGQPDHLPPTDETISTLSAGPYTGWIASEYQTNSALTEWLGDLQSSLSGAAVLKAGRHQVLLVHFSECDYVVKQFGPQSKWKDRLDHQRGSKAYRSFRAACHLQKHGVGTPAPVACLERWHGQTLAESYFVSRHEPNLSSFREELIHLYRHEPECERLMNLLQTAAEAVANLHAAGALHGDLGNQNIMMRRHGTDTWGDVMFIDLNRMRFTEQPTLQQRARDLSRIHLPSDFLRVFKAMYFGDTPVPKEFDQFEDRCRRRFDRHTASRTWRHPIRTARRRRQQRDLKFVYPAIKDLWIWDERSGQAISTMMRCEKKQNYPHRNALQIAVNTARMILPVRRQYQQLLQASFGLPVEMRHRIGMTVHPRPNTWDREREWLDRLGRCPLLLRFYHHESEAQWEYCIERVQELHAAGYPVSIAMVQDRRAVMDPQRWREFVGGVLGELQEIVEWVEVGHTINRVKWGIWTLDEYAELCVPFQSFSGGHSPVKLMGPAAIDFEYQYVAGALRRTRDVLAFDALSHHLYVDRRGAPENQQSGYGTVEKAALAKAMATVAPHCGNRLILSEVNWPLLGTGVYSPVGSPYEVPGPRYNNPSVTEEVYAEYMVRYYLLALCSGHAERVYWWRLVAHGFGLIDDRCGETWRARPAFTLLQHMLATIGDSRFIRRHEEHSGVYGFEFERPDGERLLILYAHPQPVRFEIPFAFRAIEDAEGDELMERGGVLELTGRPVYVRHVAP